MARTETPHAPAGGPPAGDRGDAASLASRRLRRALLVFALTILTATFGYMAIGRLEGRAWSFFESLYMVAITLSTVGYSDVLGVSEVPFATGWTMFVIATGTGVNLWVISSLTSFFLEGDFLQLRKYRRLRKKMRTLRDHYVVCGVGTTGIHVARELLAVGYPVVAIDWNDAHLQEAAQLGALPLRGDATDDDVLAEGGIDRARGLVATLDDDKTNMFVVVTARQSHPGLRIVAKAVDQAAEKKLVRAGADAVVSPSFIGGMRLASELVRPTVVRFLDRMLQDPTMSLRIEEAAISEGSPLVGKTLADSGIRARTGVLVIAIQRPDGTAVHAPPADHRIAPGETLIVIGTAEQVANLHRMVAPDDDADGGRAAPPVSSGR
ncbi:MAG: potassium channel protein [Deltaproteobacteria bacterium]|nr:MAG: potassium channel protein [Deltaproteobacteria bacterium]